MILFQVENDSHGGHDHGQACHQALDEDEREAFGGAGHDEAIERVQGVAHLLHGWDEDRIGREVSRGGTHFFAITFAHVDGPVARPQRTHGVRCCRWVLLGRDAPDKSDGDLMRQQARMALSSAL